MQIKYLGPSESVNVAPYGPHARGAAKDYPDDFGQKLLATSVAQRFVEVAIASPPEGQKAKKKGKT